MAGQGKEESCSRFCKHDRVLVVLFHYGCGGSLCTPGPTPHPTGLTSPSTVKTRVDCKEASFPPLLSTQQKGPDCKAGSTENLPPHRPTHAVTSHPASLPAPPCSPHLLLPAPHTHQAWILATGSGGILPHSPTQPPLRSFQSSLATTYAAVLAQRPKAPVGLHSPCLPRFPPIVTPQILRYYLSMLLSYLCPYEGELDESTGPPGPGRA